MLPIKNLNAGDVVELIAPASGCSLYQVQQLKATLESWGLVCLLSDDLFGPDLLCANTDEARFEQLQKAFFNPESKALFCVRGGYGSQRLLPRLLQLPKPPCPKIFVGMSDITALHLFLQQQWHWSTVHASTNVMQLTSDSLLALRSFLMDKPDFTFGNLMPLNAFATEEHTWIAPVVGGNLTLVQTSIGTPWQIQTSEKIVLLEEINERAYRVDRILNHLLQANLLTNAKALIFGDFIGGEEPDGRSLIEPVLARFAQQSPIPVLQLQGIGHGACNWPITLGAPVRLTLGEKPALSRH